MFSERVEQALRKAGWYPGRKVNITESVRILIAEGYTVPPMLKKFLCEYGGMKINLSETEEERVLNLDVRDCVKLPIRQKMQREIYQPRISEDLIEFGEIWDRQDRLSMSASGKMYVCRGRYMAYLGEDYTEMFENIFDPEFKPKEVSLYSERVEQALRKAGWYPGRKVDIVEYVDILIKEGYEVPEVLKRFLTEFGGIIVNIPIDKSISRACKNWKSAKRFSTVELDPKEAFGTPCGIPLKKEDIYFPRIEEDLIEFGALWNGHYNLAITPKGSFYAKCIKSIMLLGNDHIEMFENLFDPEFRPQEVPLFSKRAEQALRKGGWYPERETDYKESINLLIKEGYPILSGLIDLLYRYDGLKIAMLDCPPYNEINIDVKNTIRKPIKKKTSKEIYEPRIKDDLVIFGEIWGVPDSLTMSSRGKMFAKIGEKLYFLGDDYTTMIENLSDPEFRPQEIH